MTSITHLEEHIPALRRYAFALVRHEQDADDLVQSSLVKAILSLNAGADVRSFRPWLLTILHNLFVSEWRKRRLRREAVVDGVRADAAVPPSQGDALEVEDVWRRLNMLPDEQRQVLLLVSVEGMSYAEVASILAIPLGTVMSRLSRARDRMAVGEDLDRPALRRIK